MQKFLAKQVTRSITALKKYVSGPECHVNRLFHTQTLNLFESSASSYSIHHYCSIQCMETLTFYSARLFKSENSWRLFERREKQWRTDGKSVGESYYNIQIRHLLLKEYGNPTDRNKRSQQRLAGLYGVQVIILTVLYHPQILQHSKYYCCSGFWLWKKD